MVCENLMNLIIRTAGLSDFEGVKALEEIEFDIHRKSRPDYFKGLEESYSREEYEELLAHQCPIAFVAVQNEMIVGLCFGTIEATPENSVCKSRRIAFIEDVITMPEYRGRGIATALMKKARLRAVQEGAVSMELCVWNFNKQALRLYEKMGMRIQYYRMEDDLRNE